MYLVFNVMKTNVMSTELENSSNAFGMRKIWLAGF